MKKHRRWLRIVILSLLSFSVLAPIMLGSLRLKALTSIAGKREFIEDLASIKHRADKLRFNAVEQEGAKELKGPKLLVFKEKDFSSVVRHSSDENRDLYHPGNAPNASKLLEASGEYYSSASGKGNHKIQQNIKRVNSRKKEQPNHGGKHDQHLHNQERGSRNQHLQSQSRVLADENIKIISAIKEAGTIKRFVPSEYGNEVDRPISALPPFEAILATKRKIRRAVEEAGVSFTYVAGNTFSAYFVDYILHPHQNLSEVVVYGTGEAKVVFNYEGDVAAYTIKAATDPRVANRVIIYRPPANISSQSELISTWEKKSGRVLKRVYVPEEELVKLSETLPFPDNIPVAVLHNIFIKGDQLKYEVTEKDMEASRLYPDYNYTSIDKYLDRCVVDPPQPKLAAFA